MEMIEIKSEELFEEEVLKVNEPVLVDFNAEWCGPCKMLKPVLERIAKNHKVVSVNTDLLDNLAREYGVMSIPCMVKIVNGKEEKRLIGFHNEAEIMEFLG